MHLRAFPGGASAKEHTCQYRRHKRHGFSPWVRKIPWRRAWQPIAALLPGESHGQRSLVGYSPRGHRESDTTEATWHTHAIRVTSLFPRRGFPGGLVVKNLLQCQRPGFDPWVGEIPWRRAWQPTSIFLPGDFHEQKSLVGYSPWCHKQLDMTEATEHAPIVIL